MSEEPAAADRVRAVVAAGQPERVARTVANLLAAADRPVDVEVVAYGPGLDLVVADRRRQDAELLRASGARLLACANTLAARGIGAEELIDGVTVVPAAVWHLVLRQHEGWSLVPVP